MRFLLAMAVLAAMASAAQAANSVTPGEFVIERPTLKSLGFEWKITGDDNRNSAVDVTYRKTGDKAWKKALPLFRMGGEFIAGPKPQFGPNYYNYTVPPGFAGSVLGLEPDTEYEVHFAMHDPDGGDAEKTATVKTRAVPKPAAGGHVYHVWPFSHKGPLPPDNFTGLLAAYYLGADESDHNNVFPPRVKPGDIILVHAGTYKDNRFVYGGFDKSVENYGTSFDGTYYLTASGTPDKPIVIKAAGDGEVVFDGADNDTLFNLEAANYTMIDGITVKNTNVAYLLGIKDIIGADGFTLVNSRAINVGRVVRDDWAKSKDYYIANNVFLGRHDPSRITSWIGDDVWKKCGEFPALITSEYAVKVYGQGHVVAHNYVANFHDAIDDATFGVPPSRRNMPRRWISTATTCSTSPTTASSWMAGCTTCAPSTTAASIRRIWPTAPSRFSAVRPISIATSPITMSPPVALKLLDNPSGILIYNNTFIGAAGSLGPASNYHFRNNLIVGDGWHRPIFQAKTFTPYSSSDYNGFGPNPVDSNFAWDTPPFASANGGQPHDLQDPGGLSEGERPGRAQHHGGAGYLCACHAH